MTTADYSPAITSIRLFTNSESPDLILYKGKENILNLHCTVSGLNQRTVEIVHETPDYFGIQFTLLHQFGGMETTVVRQYLVEYDPKDTTFESNNDQIELTIPIDDDFLGLDFVFNYYFLQISFTSKHPGEMGLMESLYSNKILKTKIPFIVSSAEELQ